MPLASHLTKQLFGLHFVILFHLSYSSLFKNAAPQIAKQKPIGTMELIAIV
jgi:hypothetical protein